MNVSAHIKSSGELYQKKYGGDLHTDGTSYLFWTPAEGELCTPVLLCRTVYGIEGKYWDCAVAVVFREVLDSLRKALPCVLVTNGSEGLTNFVLKENPKDYQGFFNAIVEVGGRGARLMSACGRDLPKRTAASFENFGFILSKTMEAPASLYSVLTEELLAPIVKVSSGILNEHNTNLREVHNTSSMLVKVLPTVVYEEGYLPRTRGVLPSDNAGKGTAAIELDLGDPEQSPRCALCKKGHRKAKYYASINGHLCDVCAKKIGHVTFMNWFKAQIDIERERERSRAANRRNKVLGARILCPHCGSDSYSISSGKLTLSCDTCFIEFYVDNNLCTYYLWHDNVYKCDALRRKILYIKPITDEDALLARCYACDDILVKQNSIVYINEHLAKDYLCPQCAKENAAGWRSLICI